MLHKATVVLAIVLVLGNFGLSTSALARGGGHGGRADSFRGNGSNVYRTGGLHGGLRGYGNHDVWGHWGTYYGPMIPAI